MRIRSLIAGSLVLLVAAAGARADYVSGLDPAGDNYLSLRVGPGSSYREILRMRPDTMVTVIANKGAWRKVRLENGAVGWAFGKYIAPGLPPSTAEAPKQDQGAGNYDVVEPPKDAAAAPEASQPPQSNTDDQTPAGAKEPDDSLLMDGIIEDIERGLAGGT